MNYNEIAHSLKVGSPACDFTATAVMRNATGQVEIVNGFNLGDYTAGYPYVLFFYPLDFTFVCPTELIELDRQFEDISKLGAKVIAISVDSQYSHHKYMNTEINNGGIGIVKFPLISDLTKEISSRYGVLSSGGVAFRATVIVDSRNIIQHITMNNMPIGRNIDEIKRVIEAVQFHEVHGTVCPANWSSGKAAMSPTIPGMVDFLSKHYSS